MVIRENLVSIIIPVYNSSKFICDTLDSVKKQTYNEFECIIVDDGSTDGTAKIVKEWIFEDKRFKYVYQSNAGLSAARNKGLEYAKGDFIQFLDADDVILPLKLEKQIQDINKEFDKTKTIVSYTDYAAGTSEDIYKPAEHYLSCKFISSNYVEELIACWESTLSIPPHCFLFSAVLFTFNKIKFDTTLKNHEDFDCWLKIFHLQPQVRFVNERLCIYRITEGSMSKQMKLMGEGFLQVLNKHVKSGVYTKSEIHLLLKKRRTVLVSYRRFNLMNWYEKILSIKVLVRYYSKRVLQKTGLIK